jgi:membrane protein YqaA with SNARE-associated domain
MLKRFYDRLIEIAAGSNAIWAIIVVAFVESSFFPIPPDVLLIPMMLARPRAAWRLAAYCVLASVAGGMLGYAIGYYGFDLIGRPILEFYGAMPRYDALKADPYPLQAGDNYQRRRTFQFHRVCRRLDRLTQYQVLLTGAAAVVVRAGGTRLHREATHAGDQRFRGLPRWRVCRHPLSMNASSRGQDQSPKTSYRAASPSLVNRGWKRNR